MGAGLSSCGDSSADAGTAEGLAAVTIAGKPGAEPEVTWKSKMTSEKQVTKTLETGDGAEVKTGDQVLTHIWIGNGFTQKKAFSTYDAGKPETVTVDDQLSPVFADAIKGHTLGSRVAVTTPADKAFGPSGNPDLKIGNKDAVLVVIDLISIYTPPEAVDVPKSQLPSLITGKNGPVGLDFKGLKKPKADGDLLRSVIREGKGNRHLRHDRHRQLPRPGLRRQEAVRRELLQAAGPVLAHPGRAGLDPRALRPQGRQPGAAPDPA